MRRLDAAILALLIALAPLPARAQDEEKEQPVEYPKEWGPNVAAAARGCKVVELLTHSSRVDAQRFYKRLGFSPSHVGMTVRF